MTGLSKSRILSHRQCPKRLWLHVNRPELAVDAPGVAARLAAGRVVGEVARGFYPDGILIATGDLQQALADTAQALAEKRRPIFEAAFAADGVLIRVDVLRPVAGGYTLLEVKSSSEIKPHYLEDAAIQLWVAECAGLPVKHVKIVHIDTGFIYPGNDDYEGLFAHVNISKDVRALGKEVPKWVKAARKTLAGKEPNIEPGDRCGDPYSCPFLGYCSPEAEDCFPPEILPHKDGKALAVRLRAEGYEDLRKVPKKYLTTPKHLRIWRATRNGKAELAPEAGEELKALGFPRYYLDFETMQFAIPIWAGTRPYRQIPFQWSCHIERKNGKIGHKAFLAEGKSDPRRTFAESLIETLKTNGPVLVYSAGFEGGRLHELAGEYPDLAPALNAIRNRFVDLLVIAREHYYHRDIRGSWSLKAVLPTIAPELAYDDLAIADGTMAQAAFAELLHPNTSPARGRKLRQDLLAYCERDTWALVRIAHFFTAKKAPNRPISP